MKLNPLNQTNISKVVVLALLKDFLVMVDSKQKYVKVSYLVIDTIP